VGFYARAAKINLSAVECLSRFPTCRLEMGGCCDEPRIDFQISPTIARFSVADIHENALPGWVELKKIGDCLLRESLIDTTTE